MTIPLSQAVETLMEALRADGDSPGTYYYTWQANIAMAFKDEWQHAVDNGGLPCTPQHIHDIANGAAKNFLNTLIRINKTC